MIKIGTLNIGEKFSPKISGRRNGTDHHESGVGEGAAAGVQGRAEDA